MKMAEKLGDCMLAVSFLMQIWVHFILPSSALRMINLDAPQMALEGDTIQLSCSYSLVTPSRSIPGQSDESPHSSNVTDHLPALDAVYAIKWYRDEGEFFRYLARDWPHKQSFTFDGLDIDMEKSDNKTVVLRNVSLKTSGLFRCEVSIEAPSFLTKSIERRLSIYHLPSEGPLVEYLNPGLARHQFLDTQLNFRCQSKESKPGAKIDWIINDKLNLSAIKNLSTISDSQLPIQLLTRRVVRLPFAQLEHRAMSSVSRTKTRLDTFVHLVENQLATTRTEASTSDRVSFTAYTLEDPEAAVPDYSDKNSISLEADSLQHLLESSISWLNLTVDANFLQYLSSVGASADKPDPPDSTWTSLKAIGASTNFMAPPNRTSPGNSLSKTRGKTSRTNLATIQRNSAYADQKSRRLSLKVRCVARVMHLSLSGDIRLLLVNKNSRHLDTETLDHSIKKQNDLRRNGACRYRSISRIKFS